MLQWKGTLEGALSLFEFISGKIDFVHSEYIVVEANGIGYLIYCPNPFVYKPSEALVKIYTYHHVREDANHLYGFPSREEKELFKKLLTVSGIGPKSGLAILAAGEPGQIANAIEQENETFLMKFPGVGKKTARQIILDLKGKLNGLFVHERDQKKAAFDADEKEALSEAVEALKALGYGEKEIEKVLPKLKKEQLSTEAFIKKALQLLIHN